MRHNLSSLTVKAYNTLQTVTGQTSMDMVQYLKWIEEYPGMYWPYHHSDCLAQVIILASQIYWSTSVERSLSSSLPLSEELRKIESILRVLADYVLEDLASLLRKKCEQLITELVRQRDAVRGLLKKNVSSCNDFEWLSEMRFYLAEASTVRI